ncbi:MAG: hypothetical protein ACPLRZ_06395 [Thermovenabulum sp.]|uniref:hypothetical protein n=1 Tax=Thermovenabulum sp. TaxID=3100335 RepID=UPI003C7D9799
MISGIQKKGLLLGILWGFISWIPYFTDILGNYRNIVGLPATLGLNLELALNHGNSVIFSVIIGALICFLTASLFEYLKENIKIVGLPKLNFQRKVKIFKFRRGY